MDRVQGSYSHSAVSTLDQFQLEPVSIPKGVREKEVQGTEWVAEPGEKEGLWRRYLTGAVTLG